MFRKKNKLPDLREPVIQVLRLIEEKPYYFKEIAGDFHLFEYEDNNYPRTTGIRVLSLITFNKSYDDYDVMKISIKEKNGDVCINDFSKDEIDYLSDSLKKLDELLRENEDIKRRKKQEESRKYIYDKIKNL
jgi:hypothetical protein